jgi:hypothetical protein
MNKRIQELHDKAFDGNDILEPNWFLKHNEKFARLIVEECVKLCEHESNDDEYDLFDMGQLVKAENIKTSIKQHFGVEE